MAASAVPAPPRPETARKPWYRQLYFWVLTAIVTGILTGWLWPSVGTALEPVGTTFVAAIKMLITPIVFLTIVAGIGSVDSLGRATVSAVTAGRVAWPLQARPGAAPGGAWPGAA